MHAPAAESDARAPADFSGRVTARGWYVIVVLLVSVILRVVLVARGGAFYWTDEKRFNSAREAVAALAVGDWGGAIDPLLSTSEHIGFRWLALPAAVVERAVYGDLPPHAKTCAAWMAVFSLVNLALIWAIARRTSTRAGEAEWALTFAACSNALFYFARHCFPYDAALTFFLLAMYVSVGRRTRWSAWLVGLGCGLGYLVYNGYWSVGAVICLLDVAYAGVQRTASSVPGWHGGPDLGESQREKDAPAASVGAGRSTLLVVRAKRAVLVAAGLATPIALVVAAGFLHGTNLLADSVRFAGTVVQGDFGIGWRFIGDYVLAADAWFEPLLAVIVGGGLLWMVRRRRMETWVRWVVAVALLGVLWLALCDVAHVFVLYGRTVRAAVPFLALAAAGAARLLCAEAGAFGRRAVVATAAVACGFGLFRMADALRQTFPAEFRLLAAARIAQAHREHPTAVFRTLYAGYLFGPPKPELLPPHHELLRRRHPHQYAPYLYEGYTQAQRPLYLNADCAMRLVEIDAKDVVPPPKSLADALVPTSNRATGGATSSVVRGPAFGANHGSIRLQLEFPSESPGATEPLLCTGRTGEADQLLVSYVEPGYVRFGVDHWGGPVRWSDRVPAASRQPHQLVVSFGPLFPAEADPVYETAPAARLLPQWLFLKLDQTVVFSELFDYYAAEPDSVTIGHSTVGGSYSARSFAGRLISIEHVSPLPIAAEVEMLRGTRIEVSPPGAPQKSSLTLQLPIEWRVGREPLLTIGRPDHDVVFFLRYIGREHVRLGVRAGDAMALSRAIRVDRGATHRLEITSNAHRTEATLILDGLLSVSHEVDAADVRAGEVHVGFTPLDEKWVRTRFSGHFGAR